MNAFPEIRTARLVLRNWRADDLAPFAAMNADARVMAFFPALLACTESDAMVSRIRQHFAMHGFGIWAVESLKEGALIGSTGLQHPRFEAHFTPCVEVGWKFAAAYWGRGYATEAARAALQYGFEQLGLNEIVAFATRANRRSLRVMEKLGMQCNPWDDFDHPSLPEGHPLRRHALYRIDRTAFQRHRDDLLFSAQTET